MSVVMYCVNAKHELYLQKTWIRVVLYGISTVGSFFSKSGMVIIAQRILEIVLSGRGSGFIRPAKQFLRR